MESYEAPEIIEVGSVEKLTEGETTGELADGDFTIGDKVTFLS